MNNDKPKGGFGLFGGGQTLKEPLIKEHEFEKNGDDSVPNIELGTVQTDLDVEGTQNSELQVNPEDIQPPVDAEIEVDNINGDDDVDIGL